MYYGRINLPIKSCKDLVKKTCVSLYVIYTPRTEEITYRLSQSDVLNRVLIMVPFIC